MADHPHSVGTLGEIIRRQRERAELSMRQLAAMVGISNPYLSQIERNLRAPSDRVLRAIASALQTSADALLDQVSQHGKTERPEMPAVVRLIREDPDLTNRQRQVLVDVYTALVEQTALRRRRRNPVNGQRPTGKLAGGPQGLSDLS